ncbi:putative histidine kinase [Helianthus annuus]|nr:putative histidine kinase [Helianthus annuus]
MVVRLINPIACVKKVSMTLNCDMDLPAYGFGDEKRLMQTILNVAGNAVKFTKEGHVSVEASVLSSEFVGEWRTPEFCPTLADGLFYLLVQVSIISKQYFNLEYKKGKLENNNPIFLKLADNNPKSVISQ